MTRKSLFIALAIAFGFTAQTSGAQAADAGPRQSCFSLQQLQGTRADGPLRIYARVGLHDIYRLDLAFKCYALTDQNGIILTPAGGRDNICRPLDLDLRARQVGGGSEPCMIKSITKLTPEEAAALPRKVIP